jgi:hypothetical protein
MLIDSFQDPVGLFDHVNEFLIHYEAEKQHNIL